jgi:hypothetical protein
MILARKCRELGSLALENRKDVSITCRFGQLNYIIRIILSKGVVYAAVRG